MPSTYAITDHSDVLVGFWEIVLFASLYPQWHAQPLFSFLAGRVSLLLVRGCLGESFAIVASSVLLVAYVTLPRLAK